MTEEELIDHIAAIKPEQMRQLFKAVSQTSQQLGLSPLQATTIVILQVLSSGFPAAQGDIIMMLKRSIACYESPDNPYHNYKPARN